MLVVKRSLGLSFQKSGLSLNTRLSAQTPHRSRQRSAPLGGRVEKGALPAKIRRWATQPPEAPRCSRASPNWKSHPVGADKSRLGAAPAPRW
jgi:hypothetical protein